MWPNEGFFPQTAQTFDMSGREVYLVRLDGRTPNRPSRFSPARRPRGRRSCLAGGPRPDVREEIRHLESGAGGVGRAIDPRLGLLARVTRDHSERDRDTRLDGGELKAACGLAGHEVEVHGLAADDAPERDDARVPSRLRESEGRQGKLERAGHGHDGDGVVRDVTLPELGYGDLEQ